MARSSELDNAYQALSINGARKAILFILEEMTKEAESVVLEASPSDDKLSEKLIRAKERRFLLEIFKKEVK